MTVEGAFEERHREGVERVDFEIVSPIVEVEAIASGKGVRDRLRLKRLYGSGYWRKMKGTAWVRLRDGSLRRVEL